MIHLVFLIRVTVLKIVWYWKVAMCKFLLKLENVSYFNYLFRIHNITKIWTFIYIYFTQNFTLFNTSWSTSAPLRRCFESHSCIQLILFTLTSPLTWICLYRLFLIASMFFENLLSANIISSFSKSFLLSTCALHSRKKLYVVINLNVIR